MSSAAPRNPSSPAPAPGRILVTGAAGFIGARTCAHLMAAGHAVVGVDNLNSYYDVSLKRHRLDAVLAASAARRMDAAACPSPEAGPFEFHQIDIESREDLEALFDRHRFDAVINLAARAGVRASIEHPAVYLTTNALGTLHLLDAMRAHGVKKLVLASTSSLYAGTPLPFREDATVTRPVSPYAASKLAAEAMAYTYHHLYGLDCTIVRYFTVYGPAGRPDMSPFRFIRWIDEGHPIELFGDGSQTRDFTYVDDVAAGTVLALKPVGYEIVNLGGGNQPLPLNQMIALLERLLDRRAVIQKRPFHAADMRETQADITRARNLLGWAPKVAPEAGFLRTVDWYRQNRDWVRTIQL